MCGVWGSHSACVIVSFACVICDRLLASVVCAAQPAVGMRDTRSGRRIRRAQSCCLDLVGVRGKPRSEVFGASQEGHTALSEFVGKWGDELKSTNKQQVKEEAPSQPPPQERKSKVEPQTRWTLNDMYDFMGPEAMTTTFFNSKDARGLGEDTHVDLVFIKTLAASLEARMWASYRTSVASVREHISFDLQKSL